MTPTLRRGSGFTLLELAVVVAVVAVLITIALDRLLRYAELAERGAMEQSVGAMKSALGLRFAAFYVQGRMEAIRGLSEENPMDWLAERPPAYLGALWDPPLESLERPGWYFDRARGQLVYLPRRTRYLVAGPDGEHKIAFRVVVEFRPAADSGGAASLERLGIDPVQPINWFEDLQ